MIIIAVIILAMLSIIGIAATNTSNTEMKITTNALLHNTAFYTADSGIAAGRATLNNVKMADAGSWDVLLRNQATNPPGTEVITWNGVECTTLDNIIDADGGGGRTVGPATFSLTIEDNNDLDNNDEVDSDDTIFLTSTLVAPYRNATATIRTSVQGGGEAYAQEHYNAGSSGEAKAESETAAADVRW